MTLTREQRSVLSQMTDLSGPAPVSGFDGYVSGFPLPGAIYALTKTWYAIELPRPGCVWTHSLLLTADVLNGTVAYALLGLFRRPHAASGFGEYGLTLATVPPMPPEPAVLLSSLERVIDRLYGQPTRRVCVAADTADDVEALALAVWNQQWMRLRQAFSFTTGMLGNGSRAFDLQGVPIKNRALFTEAAGFVLVEPTGLSASRASDWAQVAAKDAATWRAPNGLRHFLATFGNDFLAGRSVYEDLCQTFRALGMPGRHERATAVLECVKKLSQQPTETANLRMAIFGGVPGPWALDEVSALEVLAFGVMGGVLDDDAARIPERAAALDRSDLEALVSRLPSERVLPRAGAILEAFLRQCESRSLPQVPVTVAAEALRRRADLGRDPVVWERPEEEARELLAILIADGSVGESIAYGLLRHGDMRLLHQAERAPSSVWVRAARTLTDALQPLPEIEEFVLGRLWVARSELRADLAKQRVGGFVKYAAAVLDVSTYEAEAFPLECANLVADLPRLHDPGADLQACGFLFMVGLCRKDQTAAALMAAGFSTVYIAARDKKLPWDLWRRFEPLLPWHVREWDRCVRLTEGAVTRFADRSWPSREFFRTFCRDEEFERAMSILQTTRGRAYMIRLRADVQDSASQFQRERLLAWGS
jgi:hypothetical protein